MAQSSLFCMCSILMSTVFAYSASVQLNDPDWYFWLPLYASASAVNFLQVTSPSKTNKQMAKLALWLGSVLFFKVLVEDYVEGIAGTWSADLSERVVREKMGSGFVVVSMVLQLKAFAVSSDPDKTKSEVVGIFLDCGMALLVALNLGLCIAFFLYVKEI